MRAAVCQQPGPPQSVSVGEWPDPELGAAQVRVAVRAAAVNFPDVLIVADRYQIKVPTPFVPGSEFAGTVTEVSPEVTTLAAGDRVFGTVMVGAFAEQVVVPATSVTKTPDGVGDPAAAAFGVAHRTAYNSLRSVARLQEGEELVVLGAGGGVGLAAVQIGRLLGARVTAVASSKEKLDAAEAEGAERVIDHRAGDLRAALRAALPDGSDVVLDPVGGGLAEPAFRSLRWGGRFVTVGFASGSIPAIPLNLVLLKGARILGFEFRSFGINAANDLASNERELMTLLASGRVSPHIGATFALDRAADALEYVGAGRAVGKVVIEVAA